MRSALDGLQRLVRSGELPKAEVEHVAALTEQKLSELERIIQLRRDQGLDAALAIIDSSPYGLLTSVFTRDLGRGLRFAEAARAGWVNVNESTNYWESHLPFGGRAGSQSGIGRVGGRFSMETFTELKTVVVNLG